MGNARKEHCMNLTGVDFVSGFLSIFFSNIFLIFIEFLGWCCLIELYRFQMCNSITHHLYVYCVVCTPPQLKSPSVTTDLPSTFCYLPQPPFPLVITILLSVSVSFVLFCFVLFLLNPFTFSLSPLSLSPLTAVSLFSVSMSLFLFCLLVQFVH